MRPLLRVVGAAALLALAPCVEAAPDFAPNPKQAYQGFVAINPPRADVPVGALWINNYGPTGDAAGSDNLETVKSLSGLSIDKNLQLDLNVGLLNLLGIDPKAHDHYVAHFSDISIVRVKDVSRLSGTKGEPRIVEALKAGTVTVSSDSGMGLTGQTTGWQTGGVMASTNNDRTKTYSIEAHDMFIAIHVATPAVTQSKEQELRIAADGKSARIDDFLLVITRPNCPAPTPCSPNFGIAKLNTQTATPGNLVALAANGDAHMRLPVPIADGQSGLYQDLVLRWLPPCTEHKAEGCRKDPRLFGHYEGTRLQDLDGFKAKNW
jgi:hypothetical protein